MFFPIEEWLPAFLLTLVVEEIVVLGLLLRLRPSSDLVRASIVVLFANLATHTVVWFVLTQLLLAGSAEYTVTAEVWAVVAEALCYWAALTGVSAIRAVGIAVTANAISFVIGLAVGAWLPQLTRLPG